MQYPIGVSDFRKLVTTRNTDGVPYTFVDKTLFIHDILNDSTEVKVITRPRRFGKTLNLSMLYYFLSKEIDGQPTAPLFQNLKIAQYPDLIEKHQGQYPVIFLTLKDIKNSSWEKSYADLCIVIRTLYETHEKIGG